MISDFLQSLVGAKNTPRKNTAAQLRQIEQWASEGFGEQLFEIAMELKANGAAMGIDPFIGRSILGAIIDNLALSQQRGFALLATRLALIPPQKQEGLQGDSGIALIRSTAQKVATGATKETLVALFDDVHSIPA
ncbi:MAG: hypothetical protein EOP06_24790, partial [Proteobacteria bacterium]